MLAFVPGFCAASWPWGRTSNIGCLPSGGCLVCFTCVKLQHQTHPEIASRLLAQPKLDSVLALAGTTVPSRNTSQMSLKCRLPGSMAHVFWILLALALQTLEIVTSVSHPSKQPHRKIRKISKNHRNMLLVIPSIPSSGPSICCSGSAGGKKNDGAVSCDAVSWGAVSWAAASWDAVSPETCEAANCEVRPGMPKCGISWACACAASMYWAARRLCCDSMVSACNADVASGLVLGKQVHHWHAMSKQVPIPIDA